MIKFANLNVYEYLVIHQTNTVRIAIAEGASFSHCNILYWLDARRGIFLKRGA